MRFLFRVPKHQKFQFEPRYYDPIKEELKRRTKRINGEISNKEQNDYPHSVIKFNRKIKKAPYKTSILQVIIALTLGILSLGWLYLGNEIFYYLGIGAIVLYFFFRITKFIRR